MKATVVVPVYNMQQYVGQTLGSLMLQLSGDWEAIVVDDGSTDGTVDVVLDYIERDTRIKLIRRQKNGGVSAAVNDGIRAATGAYICPLGGDDLLEPWMIEKQSAYLDSHPDIAAVFGMPLSMHDDGTLINTFDEHFSKPQNRSRIDWYNTLLQGNVLMGQTMLFRKDLTDELGYWDGWSLDGNDVDWFIRPNVINH